MEVADGGDTLGGQPTRWLRSRIVMPNSELAGSAAH